MSDAPAADRAHPARAITPEQLWAIVAITLPVLAVLLRGATSPDLAYQLRLGELILDTGSIPRSDSFTFTVPGREWIDQQWSAQVVLALASRAGGWAGLHLLRAVVVGLASAFLYAACRARGASARAGAVLTVAGSTIALPALTIRPQLLAVPLFTATMWIAATRARAPRRVWVIPLLVVVWANLHGSVVLAPVVVLLTSLADLDVDRPRARRLVLVAAACIPAALVNPFGVELFGYLGTIATNDTVRGLITEWQPPSLDDVWGAIFLGSGIAVAVLLARRSDPVRWPDLAWLVVFFGLGLTAYRSVLWWALAAPVGLAGILARGAETPARAGTSAHGPGGRRGRIDSAIAVSLVALVVLALPGVFRPWSSTVWLPDDVPAGLTEAARRELADGTRTFVSQPWASWFELEVSSLPLFVDSRIELFPGSVWDDYATVVNGRDGWQDVLDRYDVQAVVEPRQGSELFGPLSRDPGWTIVAQDADGGIFVRSPTL